MKVRVIQTARLKVHNMLISFKQMMPRWKHQCGAMKMAKSCKEGTEIEEDLGWKVTGSKLNANKGLLLRNLLENLPFGPLVICIHKINLFVKCIG